MYVGMTFVDAQWWQGVMKKYETENFDTEKSWKEQDPDVLVGVVSKMQDSYVLLNGRSFDVQLIYLSCYSIEQIVDPECVKGVHCTVSIILLGTWP